MSEEEGPWMSLFVCTESVVRVYAPVSEVSVKGDGVVADRR